MFAVKTKIGLSRRDKMQQVSRGLANYGVQPSGEHQERIKRAKPVEVLSKEETLRMRTQHVG